MDEQSSTADVGGSDRFAVEENWRDRVVVLAVSGAVDLLTAPQLTEAVSAAMTRSPAGLIVDLSDVDFLASAGMTALVIAQQEVAPFARFGVVADGPSTSRPIKLIGIDSVLALYRTLDEALGDVAA